MCAEKRVPTRAGASHAGPVDITVIVPTSSTASSTLDPTQPSPQPTLFHAAFWRSAFSSRSIFSIDIRNAESLVTRRMIRLCAWITVE
jgi:hypothetical protein